MRPTNSTPSRRVSSTGLVNRVTSTPPQDHVRPRFAVVAEYPAAVLADVQVRREQPVGRDEGRQIEAASAQIGADAPAGPIRARCSAAALLATMCCCCR